MSNQTCSCWNFNVFHSPTIFSMGSCIKRSRLSKACIFSLVLFALGAQSGNKTMLLNPAALTERAPENFKASFDTSAGVFVVEVHRDWAPNGADRFYNLVKSGFYD